MVKFGIKIFARVKPSKGKLGDYDCDEEDDDDFSYLSFNVPKDLAKDFVNNKKELYKFRFDKAFDKGTRQDDIFEYVARDVIDNVLSGYNGTIFAYGQTGSGKTFTITGGAEKYSDRGIIPRTLSYMFDRFEKNPEYVHTCHISYLEIYNQNGYDLLDPKHEAAKLEDLPKISLMEDNDGNIHLKNLSLHQASNEEEALNWLFLGDTNRMIAETPMNQASTRSHCVFTIHVSCREPGSATLKRAKLHLVDLAGSERIHKTNVDGLLLTEAKYINLSLHHLEQVIVALSEKSRTHIPYRNSLLTSVLRDSLGGNCRTTMIATLSVDRKNIDESISTCRFAQRVAMIKNDAILNEEIDPKLMIIKLKQEIQQLKDELSISTGQQYKGELSEEEIERLRYLIKTYIDDNDPEAMLQVGGDMRKINFSFKTLKENVLERQPKSATSANNRSTHSPDVDSSYLSDQNETKKLKDLIQQRDNEISILYRFINERLNNEINFSMGQPVSEQLMGIQRDIQCNHISTNGSLCVTCTTLTYHEHYITNAKDVDFTEISKMHSLKMETDSWFKKQLDLKSLKMLARLRLEIEAFTVEELRGAYRKSRVALDANFTNTREIHEDILRELEAFTLVQKKPRLRATSHSREMSREAYRLTLEEFHEAHDSFVELSKAKLEAEKRHLRLLEKLQKTKKEHDDTTSLHLREIHARNTRERKKSM